MNIFDTTIDHFHHHRDQEHDMTQRQQQPFSMADHLHRLGDVIDGNPLAARLLAIGLGTHLTQNDADHVTAIIAAIEQSRIQITAPADGTTAQPAQHDAAQFPPASQQPAQQ